MASRQRRLHHFIAGLVFVSFATALVSCARQATCPSAPPRPAVFAPPARPTLVGTYEGYAEGDDSLPAPMVLKIDAVERDGQLRGTFRFGTKVDAVPDPPPGLQVREAMAFQRAYEGFPHTLRDGRLDGDRLRFRFSGYEPFASWCARRKPYATSPNSWSCDPPSSHGAGGKCFARLDGQAAEQEFDCTAMYLCPRVCECDHDRCGANMEPGVTFDMVLEGDKLVGSMRIGVERVPVRFVRNNAE